MVLAANGECTGCGETPYFVEMINDAQPCEIAQVA